MDALQGVLPYFLIVAVLFPALVRSLRYRRSHAATHRFPTRASYRSMTLEDAFTIQSCLAEVEFPTLFFISIFFALFKTYGIPSISGLLLHTGQLAEQRKASKRIADTDGIARMNYLHSLYQKAGKISNNDMLYTLSLFALEPIRWIGRFEWREVNEVERCAMGTYWRFLGEAMDISYIALHSHQSGWTDGLHFLDELALWSESYESTFMIPGKSNHTLACCTIETGMYRLPKALHGICMPFVAALLQPRVRHAMMLDDPRPCISVILELGIGIRKFLLRHLFLPRPYYLRNRFWDERPNASGRLNAKRSISLPWYIKPTLFNRWGPKAWIQRIIGCKLPGDDDLAYMPEGYIISELGPEGFRRRGGREMEATRYRLADSRQSMCPFIS